MKSQVKFTDKSSVCEGLKLFIDIIFGNAGCKRRDSGVTKIPRDVSAAMLVKALAILGYVLTRQKGSPIRITTQMGGRGGEHHEVIPDHDPIKIGTFHDIFKSIAGHHHISLEALLRQKDL